MPPPRKAGASTHLADVLAEGGHGNHLAEEVEVGGDQRHDAAAVEHGQAVFVKDGAVLREEGREGFEFLGSYRPELL